MVLDSSWSYITENYGHKGVTIFHVVAFVTGCLNFILNAFMWRSFHANPKLLSKSHLHLFYAFAITNCLTGLSTMPTYVNLFLHNNLNCPRWTILIGSSFEIALEKVRAILSLAIAIDRMHAIFCPGDHFFMDHRKFAIRICILSILCGFLDSIFLITEDSIFAIRVHCVTTSSSGPLFHWYFLLSTIICGVTLTVLYIVLICRLFILKGYHAPLNRSVDKHAGQQYTQANSLTITVILLVLMFSILPCSLYLIDMILGKVIFMQWGPIVTIGYHIYGILSFFFYNLKHHDIRESIIQTYPRLCRYLAKEQDKRISRISSIKGKSGASILRVEIMSISHDDEVHL